MRCRLDRLLEQWSITTAGNGTAKDHRSVRRMADRHPSRTRRNANSSLHWPAVLHGTAGNDVFGNRRPSQTITVQTSTARIKSFGNPGANKANMADSITLECYQEVAKVASTAPANRSPV